MAKWKWVYRSPNAPCDYKYKASPDDFRTESTGFSSRKQLAGRDSAEVYILLQHRWEDEDGNVFAHRVGTGRERYIKSTPDWVNGHSVPIHYGDITGGRSGLGRSRRTGNAHVGNGFGYLWNGLYRRIGQYFLDR